MYRVGQGRKSRRRRIIFWTIVTIIFVILVILLIILTKNWLKPATVIHQSKSITTQVNFDSKTKTFQEPDFTVALPIGWQQLPRPAGPYQLYRFAGPDTGSDGQLIDIYENVIPPNFDVNRVQDVAGEIDHMTLNGTVSDNCSTFTKNTTPVNGESGVPAKWLGVDFICDQGNTTRDVIGTTSPDGVNIVNLRSSNGHTHKFLFSYTDYSLNPDYSIFQNMLNSVAMR